MQLLPVCVSSFFVVIVLARKNDLKYAMTSTSCDEVGTCKSPASQGQVLLQAEKRKSKLDQEYSDEAAYASGDEGSSKHKHLSTPAVESVQLKANLKEMSKIIEKLQAENAILQQALARKEDEATLYQELNSRKDDCKVGVRYLAFSRSLKKIFT